MGCALFPLLFVSIKFDYFIFMLPFNIMDFSLAFNSLSYSGTDEWHTETEQNATGDEDHCDLYVRLFPYGLYFVDM